MAHSIKFLSLQKPELQYEVELRGGSGDSVQELRKEIVKLSQLNASEDILESHLDPNEDLKCTKESLLKVQNAIINLKAKFEKNLYSRTENLMNHLYHRINRINKTQEVADIYKVCVASFDSQLKELYALKSQYTQTKTPSTSTPETPLATANLTVSCERNLTSEISKLKFSGRTCVHSFILKVDEFVQSRGISSEKIISLAFEIFTDDALHWYRYHKDHVSSWEELCALLKKDFSSTDYDYRLSAEIRSRTQGERENIVIYISIMHGLFSRLSKPFTESEKLEILLHNIRPCYANTLAASPEIKTIDALVSACRNFENVQARFSSFHEPPSVSSTTLAPEFAYKYGQSSSNPYKNENKYYFNKQKKYTSNTNTTTNSSNEINAMSQYTPRPMFCPRCRSNDHTLRKCTAERVIVCFKCGKKDFRYPDCPDCNPVTENNQKN